MALSKRRRYEYRRYLPHLQSGRAPVFVSMTTRGRWILPPEARTIVMEHILRDNGARMDLFAAVVMPDHAHVLFSARLDKNGEIFTLAEIMNGIRGASAHRINRVLHRKRPVWDEEFFDHVPRFGEFEQEVEYIWDNPVRAGIARTPEEYEWLWRDPLV